MCLCLLASLQRHIIGGPGRHMSGSPRGTRVATSRSHELLTPGTSDAGHDVGGRRSGRCLRLFTGRTFGHGASCKEDDRSAGMLVSHVYMPVSGPASHESDDDRQSQAVECVLARRRNEASKSYPLSRHRNVPARTASHPGAADSAQPGASDTHGTRCGVRSSARQRRIVLHSTSQ